MKIKYTGSRTSVSTVCSGRKAYYFGPENDFTVEVATSKHASQLLKSSLHRFVVLVEEMPVKEPAVKEVLKEEPKKKGRKKKNEK